MVTERAKELPRETFRFTLEQYHRLAELDILGDRPRAELIRGEILKMPPIGPEHARTTDTLTEMLVLAFAGKARVRVGNPVTLPPDSEPQPDFALLTLEARGDASAHPGPGDVLLVIEVSDSTLAYDRSVKLELYAGALIPEYWIVDLTHGQIEQHRNPRDGVYRDVHIARRGETIAAAAFPDSALEVDRILG